MILWNVRHEGSTRSFDGLTSEEVLDGVREELWGPTDEIMGPGDTDWQQLEHHPVFAQAMADYDPAPPPPHPDETKLDMNPLIDVALVLLIFFILTTTYQELRKEFKPPDVEQDDKKGITASELKKSTIGVTAKVENGETVIRVEGEVVSVGDLESKLKQLRGSTGHDKLAMEIEPQVLWKTMIAIQDAASGAKFEEIIRVVRAPKE
jgi:biopolymer transport protein ExbD